MAQITLHLDPKLLQQCKTLALQQNITLNEFIVNVLTQFIKDQEAKNV